MSKDICILEDHVVLPAQLDIISIAEPVPVRLVVLGVYLVATLCFAKFARQQSTSSLSIQQPISASLIVEPSSMSALSVAAAGLVYIHV